MLVKFIFSYTLEHIFIILFSLIGYMDSQNLRYLGIKVIYWIISLFFSLSNLFILHSQDI